MKSPGKPFARSRQGGVFSSHNGSPSIGSSGLGSSMPPMSSARMSSHIVRRRAPETPSLNLGSQMSGMSPNIIAKQRPS